MAEPAVMTEKEKKIMQTFGKVIPKLTENQKNYLLGLGEGMDIARSGADQEGATQAAVTPDEGESIPLVTGVGDNSGVNCGNLAAGQPKERKG